MPSTIEDNHSRSPSVDEKTDMLLDKERRPLKTLSELFKDLDVNIETPGCGMKINAVDKKKKVVRYCKKSAENYIHGVFVCTDHARDLVMLNRADVFKDPENVLVSPNCKEMGNSKRNSVQTPSKRHSTTKLEPIIMEPLDNLPEDESKHHVVPSDELKVDVEPEVKEEVVDSDEQHVQQADNDEKELEDDDNEAVEDDDFEDTPAQSRCSIMYTSDNVRIILV